MKREEVVLVALSAGSGAMHSPVQIQKLLFLLDQNIGPQLGGPHFNFQPYNYGPFDKSVYEVLEQLSYDNLVRIVSNRTWKEYALTEMGRVKGEKVLESLPNEIKSYINKVSFFVRNLSFTQLVSAIYKAYPDMRQNSVFQE